MLDAFDLCDRVATVKESVMDADIETLLKPDFIESLASAFAERLDGCVQPKFREPTEWQGFLDQTFVEFAVEDLAFSEAGPYILTALFNRHLTTLRLLTSWTVTDAVGRRLSQPPLQISLSGLGQLIEDLSLGGAPISDVDDLRRNFLDRYDV